MNIHRTQFATTHPDVTWRHVFSDLNRNGQSLNVQLRRAIIRALETGMLQSGDRMPSSRQLAQLLGIARNTATSAYQVLIDEGVLISKKRIGIFIAERNPVEMSSKPSAPPTGEWSERFAINPSRLRHFNKPKNWADYPYPFLYGQFDSTIFPTNNWREAMRATSSVQEVSSWTSDLIDDDDPDLVEQLRIQVLPKRGIFATPDQIIITIGSQQALSMIVQLFTGRYTRFGLEDPGYPDLRNMVRLSTENVERLTMDDQGIVPDEKLAGCDIAYVTALHQCPTTLTMPKDRRRAILDMSREHNIILVEDDYEADLILDREDTTQPLKSMDDIGQVLYVGSFSKSLAPGLRIGFIVAPAPVIDELRVLRRLQMRHPPTNNQRILATFLGLGHYQQHLQRTSEKLIKRARLIEKLLPLYLPHCHWQRQNGAKSFWIRLPQGVDCRSLERKAREHGVLIEAADIFFANREEGAHYIRLGFTSIIDTHIASGLENLGKSIANGA